MSDPAKFEIFTDLQDGVPVRGFLHRPPHSNAGGMILAHGAGSNCQSSLLMVLAENFAAAGFTVLRCDLPFRQVRSFGPPRPGDAERDREGLKRTIEIIRKEVSGKVFLGGHSYGGRQSTILCAEEPQLVDGLLLLSYPLHPPRKPEQLRTQHFPKLRTNSFFVHGTRDPLGSIDEIKAALQLIPARTALLQREGAGHDLGFKGKAQDPQLASNVLQKVREFFEV